MKADCKGAICQLDNTLIVAVALSACRKITMELSELRISDPLFRKECSKSGAFHFPIWAKPHNECGFQAGIFLKDDEIRADNHILCHRRIITTVGADKTRIKNRRTAITNVIGILEPFMCKLVNLNRRPNLWIVKIYNLGDSSSAGSITLIIVALGTDSVGRKFFSSIFAEGGVFERRTAK